MLVLSRHYDERIVMTTSTGDRITVTIVDVRGDKVRLGIEAPPTVRINREEVQRHVDAGRPCHPHPSGLNLATIPSDVDYRHLSADQRAVRDALTEVAAAIAEQMEWTREMHCDELVDKDVWWRAYVGQNWSMGCVLRVWERHGFKGQPLDNMPPEELDDQTEGGA